tara:strand:- start:241 stop:414 length:174 start_codon:yes stop_codon:yes gene_type:complete
MPNSQTPIVAVGKKFATGTVVAINGNSVSIDTAEGVKQFSFSQVEGFINDERSLSQA